MAVHLRVLVACVFLVCPAAVVRAQTSDSTPTGEGSQLTDVALGDLLKLKVDTVYAASKFQQEITDAPASVSIVTAEEISTHGYRTLADILRSVRGFYVSYDRNYSYVGVRGFERPGDYNGRVLLLVNGHQLNDTVFQQAMLGTESPLDVALFDRVEVIRGPSSSLYGASAFFAVVNIITKTGGMFRGVEGEGQTGSLGVKAGRVTAGGKTASGLEGLLSLSVFNARGNRRLYFADFDAPETNHGVVNNGDGNRSVSLFGHATLRQLQVQMGYGARDKVIPTASFDTTFNDTRTATRDGRGFLDLQVSHPLSPRTTINLGASYDTFEYDGTYAYETDVIRDGARGAWVTGEVSLVRRFERNNLTVGSEYRKNLTQDQFASSSESGVVLDDRRRLQTAALFVEDEFRYNRYLLINGGLRWDDYFRSKGQTVNPRLGVIISPSQTTAFKLIYGRAFRAPNPFELYYEHDPVSAALGPERIATYEAVWEQHVSSRLQLSASVFQNRAWDLITQKTGSPTSLDGLFFENGESVRARGVEAEVQVVLPGRARARIADAVQSATDDTGAKVSNAPSQVATFDFDVPIARTGLVAGFDSSFVGERRTVRGALVPSALVSNLTVTSHHFDRRLELAISAHNLFDVSYSDPGLVEHRQALIPQDGRTLLAKAIWRLR